MSEIQTLTALIDAEHSAQQAKMIAARAARDPAVLEALMTIFLGDDYRRTQRAAWAVGHIGERGTTLLLPWLGQMLDMLENTKSHAAVRRNVARLLTRTKVPDAWLDRTADVCFQRLQDVQEANAVRVFCMHVLDRICDRIPELRPELQLVIAEHLEGATPAYKSRAKKTLSKH
jgi:hypothetical protein